MNYNAIQIAQWFINRATRDIENGGEYLVNLKLQKLLYYAQGCNLAINDEPLFNEKIYNWEHGPVVRDVYYSFNEYGSNPIKDVKPATISEDTEKILEEVYEVFGKFSALELRRMTHQEAPWKNTNKNDEIKNGSIKDYFLREIVVV